MLETVHIGGVPGGDGLKFVQEVFGAERRDHEEEEEACHDEDLGGILEQGFCGGCELLPFVVYDGFVVSDVGVGGGALVTGSVSALMKGVGGTGGDVVEAAVQATKGAIDAVKAVGGNVGTATKDAVTGAVKAVGEVSNESIDAVKTALTKSIEGAEDVIKAI